MARIVIIGGTGYVGGHIAAEAASRGHEVVSVSRTEPERPVEGVAYEHGSVLDLDGLAGALSGAEVVVSAISPRGDMADRGVEALAGLTERLAGTGTRLGVVGGAMGSLSAPVVRGSGTSASRSSTGTRPRSASTGWTCCRRRSPSWTGSSCTPRRCSARGSPASERVATGRAATWSSKPPTARRTSRAPISRWRSSMRSRTRRTVAIGSPSGTDRVTGCPGLG